MHFFDRIVCWFIGHDASKIEVALSSYAVCKRCKTVVQLLPNRDRKSAREDEVPRAAPPPPPTTPPPSPKFSRECPSSYARPRSLDSSWSAEDFMQPDEVGAALAAGIANEEREYALSIESFNNGSVRRVFEYTDQEDEGRIFTMRISRSEFDKLLEYSSTIPTGVVVGKMWKRRIGPLVKGSDDPSHNWVIGLYAGTISEGKDGVLIRWYTPEIY